jgi:hypothetical protein
LLWELGLLWSLGTLLRSLGTLLLVSTKKCEWGVRLWKICVRRRRELIWTIWRDSCVCLSKLGLNRKELIWKGIFWVEYWRYWIKERW